MSEYQWSVYNSFAWVIATGGRWFTVVKDVYDEVAKTMSWGVYAVEQDQFGKPINVYPVKGVYIGGYTAPSDASGNFYPDRAVVNGLIQQFIDSVPPTPAQDGTGGTVSDAGTNPTV